MDKETASKLTEEALKERITALTREIERLKREYERIARPFRDRICALERERDGLKSTLWKIIRDREGRRCLRCGEFISPRGGAWTRSLCKKCDNEYYTWRANHYIMGDLEFKSLNSKRNIERWIRESTAVEVEA